MACIPIFIGVLQCQPFGHLYTAISIYVVGSKLQGYGTRPKGGMGRLELILGFRGCRREMDMEAENTISIANISFIQMARHRRSSQCSNWRLRTCVVLATEKHVLLFTKNQHFGFG